MKRFFIILTLCAGCWFVAGAQNSFTDQLQKSRSGEGTVTVTQDADGVLKDFTEALSRKLDAPDAQQTKNKTADKKKETVKQEAKKPVERHLTYVYVRFQGQTILHRRGPGDIWQGLWEPWLTDDIPTGATLVVKGFKHQLTHRTILADFHLWEPAERPDLPDGYIWIEEAELDAYAKPRLFELLLEKL